MTFSPAVASSTWSPRSLDLFLEQEDIGGGGRPNKLWYRKFDGLWSYWIKVGDVPGGALASSPAAVGRPKNPSVVEPAAREKLDVLALGSNSLLLHKRLDRHVWQDWESLPGKMTSGPAVSSWGGDRLDVFARGTDNTLQWKFIDKPLFGNAKPKWSDWFSLGGLLTSKPAAVSWGEGRIDVIIRGEDNALYHKRFDGGRWNNDWERLGGIFASGPAVSSWGQGRLDVFARGTDNTLQWNFFDGGWHEWVSLGGELVSEPSAASRRPNRVDVFALTGENILGRKQMWKGDWHEWDLEQWIDRPGTMRFTSPSGFKPVGKVDTFFKHTGPLTTKYSSTGFHGNSERWDNPDMQKLNMIAGFKFKIGPDNKPIWKDGEPSQFRPPVMVLYFPRAVELINPANNRPFKKRGNYMVSLKSHVEPEKPDVELKSEGSTNKEFKHPNYAVSRLTDIPNPPPDLGDIRDGKWHGIMGAVYNNPDTGWPAIKLWYNARATDHRDDYIYVGGSEDTPENPFEFKKFKVAPLIFAAEGIDNIFTVEHPMRIRIDSIPYDQLEIKDTFVREVELKPLESARGVLVSWGINSDGTISRLNDSGPQLGGKTDLVSGTLVASNNAIQKRFFVTAWRDKKKELMLTSWEQSFNSNFKPLADSGPHGRIDLVSMVGQVDRFFVTATSDHNGDLAMTAWQMNIDGVISKAAPVDPVTGGKADMISTVSLFDNNVHKVVTASCDKNKKLMLNSWAISPTGTISRLGDSSAGPPGLKIKKLSMAHIRKDKFVTACIDINNSLVVTIWRMNPDGSFRNVITNSQFSGGFGNNERLVSVAALNGKLVTGFTDSNNDLLLQSWSLSIDGDSITMKFLAHSGNQGAAHIVSLFDASHEETSRVVATIRDGNKRLVFKSWDISNNVGSVGSFVNPRDFGQAGMIELFDIVRIDSANFVTVLNDESNGH